jgi:hypothetical protein
MPIVSIKVTGISSQATLYTTGSSKEVTIHNTELISKPSGKGSYNLTNIVGLEGSKLSKTILLAINKLFSPKFK